MIIVMIIIFLFLMIVFYAVGYRSGYGEAMEQTVKVRKHEGHKIKGRCYFCKYPMGIEEISYGDYATLVNFPYLLSRAVIFQTSGIAM